MIRTKTSELVSIGIVHYQTKELVKLCLRAIRKFTGTPYEVIVVDNASRDDSIEYLRSVKWIRLAERNDLETTGPASHAEGLSVAYRRARGNYFLSLHTDTIVKSYGWLDKLLEPMRKDSSVAIVGSTKPEGPPILAFLKSLTDKRRWRRLFGRLAASREAFEVHDPAPYARTFCALYRMEVLRQLRLDFNLEGNCRVGENVYRKALEAGYAARLLPPKELAHLVDHITHATASINRLVRSHRTARKAQRALKRTFSNSLYKTLLEDASLDS